MKKNTILITCILGFNYCLFAQVGVNTQEPNAKAFLHVNEGTGTTKEYKGTIVSRYTTEERDLNFALNTLDSTHDGMLIYNTTEHCYNTFKYQSATNKGWKQICESNYTPTVGILASYIGIPVMVGGTTAGRELVNSQLASAIIPLKLAKDDWFMMDFGSSLFAGTVQLYLKNLTTQSIELVGTSTSNNSEAAIGRNYTLAGGASTPNPGIDPYNATPQGIFGYTSTWSEQVTYKFTATAASGEVRKYYAVWTSFPSTEALSANAGIKTELHLYRD